MVSNIMNNSLLLAETTLNHECNGQSNKPSNLSTANFKHNENESLHMATLRGKLVWRNIIGFIYLHIGALYGFYCLLFVTNYSTIFTMLLFGLMSGLGTTAGAHRLWSHKSYKAKLPLRIILMIFQSIGFQNSIYEWVRDHRVHHKFTDSNADPHNSTRGFFFSHMGWLCVPKHPDVKTKGKTIDMSDLERDGVVMFQKKYYGWLMVLFCFIIPTMVKYYCFNNSLSVSWYITIARYVYTLHATWLVNSAAHIWGMKPFDKFIRPSNNLFVAICAFGEGWHNYHHVFPWDYKTEELGGFLTNLTTGFLTLMAKIGWAYDLKTVSDEVIRKRVLRTGDGSHRYNIENQTLIIDTHNTSNTNHIDENENMVWGWDDVDLHSEDKEEALIINKHK